MTLTNTSESMPAARLDRTLEYAVVQNWNDLMPAAPSGVMRIEYETARDGSLDFLKVWASTTRGRWTRVCELWVKPLWGHETGLVLDAGFESAGFGRMLNLVMGNESAYAPLPNRLGTIQIFAPTEAERSEAKRWMDVAFNSDTPIPAEAA